MGAEVTFEPPEVEDTNREGFLGVPQTNARDLAGSRGLSLQDMEKLSAEEIVTGDPEDIDLAPSESPFDEIWYESDVKSELRNIAGISEDD